MAGRAWLILAILAAPMALLPPRWGIDPMQARNAVFILLGLSLVVWLVDSFWLRAFLGWAVVCFVWSGARLWGMAGLLGLLAWALCYREAARLTATSWPSIRWAVLAACVVQVSWMAMQAAGYDPLFSAVSWRGDEHAFTKGVETAACRFGDLACETALAARGFRPAPPPVVGWLLNPMDAALFLGLAAPMVAAIRPWLALLVAVPVLLWLHATAGVIALGITAVWLLRARWRLVVPLVVVAAAAYLWLADPQGAGVKPTLWKATALLIAQRPWLGWGPNALTYSVMTFQPKNDLAWNFVFNEWLQAGLEMGVLAPLLALGYLVTLLWRLRGRWEAAGECLPGLAILVAVSTFSIPMRIGPTALLAALYLGRLEGLLAQEVTP